MSVKIENLSEIRSLSEVVRGLEANISWQSEKGHGQANNLKQCYQKTCIAKNITGESIAEVGKASEYTFL